MNAQRTRQRERYYANRERVLARNMERYYSDPIINKAQAAQSNLRKNENKKRLFEELGGECKRCHITDTECLEFHHNKPGKEGQVTDMIKRNYIEKAVAEAKKCILLCSNCHRKVTNYEHRKSAYQCFLESLPLLEQKRKWLVRIKAIRDYMSYLAEYLEENKELEAFIKNNE